MLLLARLALDDGGVYKRENAWFRDASRELSFLRDAATLIETYDSLMTHFRGEVDRSTFGIVRRRLTLRHKRIESSGTDERLDTFRAQMETGRNRVSGWAKGIGNFDALAPGLAKTYRQGGDAMAAACRSWIEMNSTASKVGAQDGPPPRALRIRREDREVPRTMWQRNPMLNRLMDCLGSGSLDP